MARPPLLTRWGFLLEKDIVAQRGALLAWFAITQVIVQYIPPPFCWQYVAAVMLLQLGLLAFLDYRNWVRNEVQEEASKIDPSLLVSPVLLLSSPELQNQYHRWIDKTPAVAWYINFLPFFYFLSAALKVFSKNADECSGFTLVVPLPSMVLALVRVAMDIRGVRKQLQSIASLVASAYSLTSLLGMMSLNDPCALSLGPDWMSPAGTAAFVALAAAANFATTACTIQHIAALCVIVGPIHLAVFCIRSQRRHGGLGLTSYPAHYVELAVIIAAAKTATMLVGAAVRYRLAHENMKAFLRSVRPHRH